MYEAFPAWLSTTSSREMVSSGSSAPGNEEELAVAVLHCGDATLAHHRQRDAADLARLRAAVAQSREAAIGGVRRPDDELEVVGPVADHRQQLPGGERAGSDGTHLSRAGAGKLPDDGRHNGLSRRSVAVRAAPSRPSRRPG